MNTAIDLAEKYGDTTLSNYEVFMVGESVINWITAVVRLGHASPASTLDYATDVPTLGGLLVRDFVAWTSGHTSKVPGCEERMREWAAAAELDAAAAVKISDLLPPAAPPQQAARHP